MTSIIIGAILLMIPFVMWFVRNMLRQFANYETIFFNRLLLFMLFAFPIAGIVTMSLGAVLM